MFARIIRFGITYLEDASTREGRTYLTRFFLRGLLCTLCLLPCGCGRNAGLNGGPTEIVYWTGWSGHEFEAQQKLIEEFNRTHPRIHVHLLTQFNSTGSYQKVRIALAGGATPDVMSTVWANELPAYALRGVLLPLDSYLKASGRDVNREFTPGVARMLQVGRHVYALAVTTNANFIVYNKRIFREAGLDPEKPPKTIDELDRAALVCTRYDSQGHFLRYGFRPENLELWAYVFGGRWYDPATGRITADDPHNLAALRWMVSYAKRYDIRRLDAFVSTFGSNETVNGPFFVGKMAMWTTGEWAEEFLRRYAGQMEVGWFPLPAPPGGRPETTTAGGSVFVIPAACRHPAEAWEFLNWLTQPHAVSQFCWSIKNCPPLRALRADPRFHSDPMFRFAVDLVNGPNSFGPPPLPDAPTYSREIQRVEDAAMHGGDPEALLQDLQQRMTRDLQETLVDLR
ncbi:MAG TPA: ABC transporter substrate-binding protein [Chthonomonadaceae bacterium]|nr:ABC transporter substrate-binding protein [Chthonomonadaceae bacterium]